MLQKGSGLRRGLVGTSNNNTREGNARTRQYYYLIIRCASAFGFFIFLLHVFSFIFNP
jgi:hypothetical protein